MSDLLYLGSTLRLSAAEKVPRSHAGMPGRAKLGMQHTSLSARRLHEFHEKQTGISLMFVSWMCC